MTVISSELKINDITYTFRLPISRVIALERETGKPISELDHSMGSLSLLVKYSIQRDGKYLTSSEYEEFLDNINADEFAECIKAVSSVMNPKN